MREQQREKRQKEQIDITRKRKERGRGQEEGSRQGHKEKEKDRGQGGEEKWGKQSIEFILKFDQFLSPGVSGRIRTIDLRLARRVFCHCATIDPTKYWKKVLK